MRVILYPRAITDTRPGVAPGPRLRVWVGVFDQTTLPNLRWFVEGEEVGGGEPAALRPLQSVRSDRMLLADDGVTPLPNVRRAFTGVYEFTRLASGAPLAPDTPYRVGVKAGNGAAVTVEAWTHPDTVPATLDRWFNVLLVSCYHQTEDRGGLAGHAVGQLKGLLRPHLTLLLGDQVYLDLPPIKNFPKDRTPLAAKFEHDYEVNWAGPEGYSKVLAAAPSVSTPDDHEYWNNFPHRATLIENSWWEDSRQQWRDVAEAMYEGFQLAAPARLGDAVMLDVPPLSFFIADTRSKQDEQRRHAMSDAARRQLEQWVEHVRNNQRFGVFVSGQSVFSEKPGGFTGNFVDFELPNYGDFDKILGALTRLADAGRPVLCVTGDVHWGRVVAARDVRQGGREMVYEVISSPSSLVTGPLLDRHTIVKNLKDKLTGREIPWPRHSEAGDPFFAHDALGKRFREPEVKLRQRGNHVALLSFRQKGGGLEWKIRYLPLHPERQHKVVVERGLPDLQRAV